TAVKLLVQNAAQKGTPGAWNNGHFSVICEEISRIEHIIQDLLDFAKPASTRKLRFDVCATIRRAMKLIQGRAEQEKVHIEFSTSTSSVSLTGDPEQVHQVFVNLLLNSMDAMTNGGTINIEVSETNRDAMHNVSFLDLPHVADEIPMTFCQ